MQLDATPPQTPQPAQPKPGQGPGPHSPQPDPIPAPPKRIALNDEPMVTHAMAPLRWEMSETFPGMVCRKPTVRMRSEAGSGFILNHRSVVA